ncbi:RHS repeat-associated core domain-containing protein [Gilvimarinus algae]|uniref:RHS repeat-associated core domain-containing protein n=1 Tax=Gilvimarinus algae TaxID=3058037 RepID=A0ABT8TBJ9_9GAMM|nr:RHS repeat-associated core domain-containing protein [Gilvimarinus sp. SDUM040014]MDO3380753.1 RHS repeat-associated core domain-containing protein [Gilvimarinus sp. SDUM040014]
MTDILYVKCRCDQNFIDGKCEDREPVYNAGTTQDPSTGAILKISDPNNQGLRCGQEIQGEDCEGSGEPIDVPWVGNPVSCATGQKKQTEALYQSADGQLNFNLTYKKSGETKTRAYTLPIPNNVEVIEVIKPEEKTHGWLSDAPRLIDYGQGVMAFLNGRGITRLFLNGQSQRPAAGHLTTTSGGSIYTSAGGTAYHFDSAGVLTNKTDRNDRTVTYTYPSHDERVMTDDAGRSLRLIYDDLGPAGEPVPVQMTDPAGQVYSYQYDPDGYLTRVNLPGGGYREYSYQVFDDGDKRLSSIQDETGTHYAFWAYDEKKRATLSEHAGSAEKVTINYNDETPGEVSRSVRTYRSASDFSEVDYTFAVLNGSYKPLEKTVQPCPDCSVGTTQYQYDSNGYLQEKIDAAGVVTRFTYNSEGLQTQKIEAWGTPEERTTTTTWHIGWRKPLTVDEAQRLTTYTYDANGNRLTQAVKDKQTMLQRTTTWTYNSRGQVLTEDGPRTSVNDTATYTYDAQGNLATVTNALGHTTVFANYDAHGRALSITDANGVSTQLVYSPRGWLTSATTAGKTTLYTYLANGKLQSVERSTGVTLHYEYDAAQRLTAIEDDAGNRIEYTLDLMGNQTQTDIKDAAGVLKNAVTQVYNNLGRLKQTIRGGNGADEFSYDAEGRTTVQEDALNRTSTMEYDPLGRLLKQIDPAQQETEFSYDTQNNLTSVTDPNNHATAYIYNGFGEVTQLTSPDTGTTTYEYDAAGNRTAQVDARGIRTEYSYDALNRLTQVHYPSDPSLDVSYTYDQGTNGIGRLTRIDDATGYTTYSYDAWGNVVSQTQVTSGNIYTVGYSYNADNQLQSMTYPSGKVVDYSFSATGDVSDVTLTSGSNTSSLATGIAYLPFGPSTGWTLGNGLVVSGAFDLEYRLTDVQTTPVIDYSYGYDPVGNIIQWDNLLDISRSQSFDYDALDRLTDATGLYGDFDYTYDPVGNRLSKTEAGSATTDTYAYDPASNRLTGITGANPESMTYDAVGNIVTRGSDTFTYNARNRLAKVERSGAVIAEYQHNGKGERVVKAAGGNTIHFVYDLMGNIIATANGAGVVQREYVYVNGERLALLQESPTQATYFYHNDHLGTSKALTNASGTVVWQADYTPFGELTETVSIVEQPFRFPGQYFDEETGLYYNYFRDYDPGLGRYVQSDPIGLEGGINTYGYVEGNPLSKFDILGLYSSSCLEKAKNRLELCLKIARDLYDRMSDNFSSSCDYVCSGLGNEYGGHVSCQIICDASLGPSKAMVYIQYMSMVSGCYMVYKTQKLFCSEC